MWVCGICRFETVLDDCVVTTSKGTCICLRCYERETGSTKPMSKALRAEYAAAAGELST